MPDEPTPGALPTAEELRMKIVEREIEKLAEISAKERLKNLSLSA
ncbi:MAG: hypothetical protein NTX73_00750 [Rhodobacterales bacterium]|nr:hypothetical protein [Rhodobacterales bacterium]